MKISHIAAAAAITLGASGAFAANLGTLDLSSGSGGFFSTPVAGNFSDFLTFTLTIASTINGSVTSVVNGTQDVDFTTIAITGPTGASFSLLLGDPVEVWALPGGGTLLSAGSYTLTLNGSNSASQGSYAGNLAVTAVPEPQTYAMLLAGLGAVGFLARRRRS